MKLFGEYLRRLFISFSTLITGGVIGLYYVFVYPYIESWQYRFILDIAIPVVAFLVAGFLAWRSQHLESLNLKQQIADLKNELPVYKLKVVDEFYKLDEILQKIDKSKQNAVVKKANAHVPSSWLPSMSVLTGELTQDDWGHYIEKLDIFKARIEEIKSIEGYKMVNFELTNKGKADKNLNVTLHFENAELIPEFYEKEIEYKKPEKPTSGYHFGHIPNIGPIDRLGSRREIHKEEKDLLSVEYDVMRGGDVFHLHYNPIFIKSINDEPMRVKYTFKSDKLIETPEKSLTLK